MLLLAYAVALLAALGAIQAVAGWIVVRAFAARPLRPAPRQPPVTILKPICGDEPLLEEALASFCAQNYPEFQIVFGAQDAADPALRVARRLQARFPARDIAIVVDPTPHGPNRKVANLMNMLPSARHDVLVFADSDMHVRPDYLERLLSTLDEPGTGLVTTLCAGEPAAIGPAARLGATHITHSFLPGALLATALGRQDCLGTTMALRRETLERVGGLAALVEHLADDNVLGRRVRELGLAVRLANTVPVTTVQETSFRPLWQHELRWARTIGALEPVAFAASALQYPLFWAALAVILSGGALWSLGFLASAWTVRAATAHGIDRSLRGRLARPARATPVWLLPLRDVLSVIELAASYWSDVVVWRGYPIRVDDGAFVPFAAGRETDPDDFAPDETLPA